MKRVVRILCCALTALLLLVVLAFACTEQTRDPICRANAMNFGALLTDLVKAYETPTALDAQKIEADLDAIRSIDLRDYALAKSIADHWRSVYLDPDYTLYFYHGCDDAPELSEAGIPNSRRHAIVVLGYELLDGQMQPELMGRCDTAAAMAKSFPETILVCSGGATGQNNPDRHTEAGLMKAYLVETCGLDASRIFIDEKAMTTAENAVNTLEILRQNGVRSMTIVTSAYHQRWGQALYNLMAELYRQQHDYAVRIVGNYCYDIEPSVAIYAHGELIAVRQMAGILKLPEKALQGLPSM